MFDVCLLIVKIKIGKLAKKPEKIEIAMTKNITENAVFVLTVPRTHNTALITQVCLYIKIIL